MELKKLEKASHEDAFLLTDIAKGAKASWGYDQELLELWAVDLTITEDMLLAWDTFVIIKDKEIIGFCMINATASPAEIEHLWIKAHWHGNGYGKELLNYAIESLADRFSSFSVLSDPNAIGFYERNGFIKTHEVPTKPAGRFLPYLVLHY